MLRSIPRTCALAVLVGTGAIAFLAAGSVLAETPAITKVAFVQLHVDSTGISVVKVKIVDGTPKIPAKEADRPGLQYEVVLADSTVLVAGRVQDPLRQRFEYEDPDHPGELKSKMVERQSADLLVRIPYPKDMVRVDFYRVEAVADSLAKMSRTLVGSFSKVALQGGK